MIFVDTNVLVDVAQSDAIWGDWSQRQLDAAAVVDEVAINDIVYAELAVGYRRQQDLDAMIARMRLRLAPIPLFVAGKAYQRYRLAGGIRTGVLPDFFIGAQAHVADAQLLTRDVRRYRRYFPDLALIAPAD